MKARYGFSLLLVVASIGLLSCAATANSQRSTEVQRAQITVLYDAFGKGASMTKDWGYSALIEVDGKRILFDTGDNPEIFAHNAKAKGVDLTKLDFVVMSHRHSDHMGGLTYLLKVNPSVKIYAPKEGFGIYGSDLPSKFYRKADSLPAEMRYYGGSPPDTMHFGTAFPGANIQLVDKTMEVAPGITLIALVSDAPGTKELKELSLAISTPQGIVLVVGCSHPGIEAIVAEAAKINPHIHLIAGGFHLVVAPDPAIEKLAAALHETYKVDFIAPGHCTGEPTFAALQAAFGDRYIYAGLGETVGLGTNPRAQSDTGVVYAMDDSDRQAYRTLLARSDDRDDGEVDKARIAQAAP
jgi:7,8-dihydropterin-6-yl-methyl-4-(beta-D-ribofuranosyl)aminobenzene 5'-phosphate synthase